MSLSGKNSSPDLSKKLEFLEVVNLSDAEMETMAGGNDARALMSRASELAYQQQMLQLSHSLLIGPVMAAKSISKDARRTS
jgi:hypothetical protein